MKYKAVIETDDYEDFEFFEDGNGKYLHGIDAGAVNNEWILLYFTECEQETILDKIRAEIEQEIIPRNSDQYDNEAKWQNLGLRMALKVINKYKAESEK